MLATLGLTEAGDRLVRTYSGGMRRKLDLGASLVGAPRLLLLDEPTTGLDPRSRIELWDAIRTLVGQGTDVLLTTQYLDEADNLASHVVIIDHGRVVANGTPSELKQRVGGKVIEVHVRNAGDVPQVAQVLGRSGHGEVRIDQGTRQVSVTVEGGGGRVLMEALRAVEEAGVEVEDVALRQPRLDEVFLALTGQPDATAAAAAGVASPLTTPERRNDHGCHRCRAGHQDDPARTRARFRSRNGPCCATCAPRSSSCSAPSRARCSC